MVHSLMMVAMRPLSWSSLAIWYSYVVVAWIVALASAFYGDSLAGSVMNSIMGPMRGVGLSRAAGTLSGPLLHTTSMESANTARQLMISHRLAWSSDFPR